MNVIWQQTNGIRTEGKAALRVFPGLVENVTSVFSDENWIAMERYDGEKERSTREKERRYSGMVDGYDSTCGCVIYCSGKMVRSTLYEGKQRTHLTILCSSF